MWQLIKTEPVAFQAIIQAGLALAIGFGAHLTSTQIGLIMAFTAAVLAFFTRQAVTPNPNVSNPPVTNPSKGN